MCASLCSAVSRLSLTQATAALESAHSALTCNPAHASAALAQVRETVTAGAHQEKRERERERERERAVVLCVCKHASAVCGSLSHPCMQFGGNIVYAVTRRADQALTDSNPTHDDIQKW